MSPPATSSTARFASLLVAAGGALGSLSRFGVEHLLPVFDPQTPAFPWATCAVNLAGSLLLGAVLGYAEIRGDRPAWMRTFVGIGVCGSFTTLSTVSVECVRMLEGAHASLAAGYLAASFGGGVILAWLGARLVRGCMPPDGGDRPRAAASTARAPEASR